MSCILRNRTRVGPRCPAEIDKALLRETQTYLRHLAIGQMPRPQSRDAWDRFFQRYDPLVWHTVQGAGLRGADAHDCAQEAWIEILRRLPAFHYDPCRGRFSGWIWTLTRHKATDFRRHLKRNAGESVSDLETLILCPASDLARVFEQEAKCQLVREALVALRPSVSPTNYRLLHLRWVEGRSVSEIAAQLRLSPEQTRYRAYRLKKRLRRSLARAAGA